MKKIIFTICLMFGLFIGTGINVNTTSAASAASVYAYGGKGIEVYVATSSITSIKLGFAVYVQEKQSGSYTLMEFYRVHGEWKYSSNFCGSGYMYNSAPAKAVFAVCQRYL